MPTSSPQDGPPQKDLRPAKCKRDRFESFRSRDVRKSNQRRRRSDNIPWHLDKETHRSHAQESSHHSTEVLEDFQTQKVILHTPRARSRFESSWDGSGIGNEG